MTRRLHGSEWGGEGYEAMGDTYLKHYRVLPEYVDWYFQHFNGLPIFNVGEEVRVTDEAIGATAKYREGMVMAVSEEVSSRDGVVPRRVLEATGRVS